MVGLKSKQDKRPSGTLRGQLQRKPANPLPPKKAVPDLVVAAIGLLTTRITGANLDTAL